MPTRSEVARQIARRIARREFRGRWNTRELLDDCESLAWEMELTARPHVTPGSIGYMAVKRVKSGRQFRQSARSITTRQCDKRSKRPKNLRQININLRDIASIDAPPSEAVPPWMDFKTWLAGYDSRKRAVAEALAVGNRTGEVARQFGVSPGRVSQMRREFEEDWQAFQPVN